MSATRTPFPAQMRNCEGLADYDITWGWSTGEPEFGFTAVLRVKNEARNLPFVLPPLLRAATRVLVIDNGSTDNTPAVAREVAASAGAEDQLDVTTYPFSISRCGTEHLRTSPDSVHSLTYFYNWAFSHVRTRYTLKWDGDMLLTVDGERILRDLAWQLSGERTLVMIPRFGLYVDSDVLAWVDRAIENVELWGWPNQPGFRLGKGFEWEIHLFPDTFLRRLQLPGGMCFEIKWLDSDEFSHWSDDFDFAGSDRTRRKMREIEVHQRLGDGSPPHDLLRVEGGPADHVIQVAAGITTPKWRDLNESSDDAPAAPAWPGSTVPRQTVGASR